MDDKAQAEKRAEEVLPDNFFAYDNYQEEARSAVAAELSAKDEDHEGEKAVWLRDYNARLVEGNELRRELAAKDTQVKRLQIGYNLSDHSSQPCPGCKYDNGVFLGYCNLHEKIAALKSRLAEAGKIISNACEWSAGFPFGQVQDKNIASNLYDRCTQWIDATSAKEGK